MTMALNRNPSSVVASLDTRLSLSRWRAPTRISRCRLVVDFQPDWVRGATAWLRVDHSELDLPRLGEVGGFELDLQFSGADEGDDARNGHRWVDVEAADLGR